MTILDSSQVLFLFVVPLTVEGPVESVLDDIPVLVLLIGQSFTIFVEQLMNFVIQRLDPPIQ